MNKYLSLKNIIIILSLLAVLLLIRGAIISRKNLSQRNSQLQELAPKASAQINKSFEFNALNATKKSIPVAFTIVSAERKDDIKVKGEDRKPVSGKDYLLLRIEIENKKAERVAITSADHVRLEMDGKLYAPDYHNGNIIVDALSTKKDLIAFAVETKIKIFSFQVGELEGEKQKIDISF